MAELHYREYQRVHFKGPTCEGCIAQYPRLCAACHKLAWPRVDQSDSAG